jgi:ABC-type transport system involved in cytochrome bd biosynthesis fused ATPase/permease subunit
MEKKNIIITVSSKAGVGKSSITFLLKSFLKKNGFEVEFNDIMDFSNEHQFDTHVSKNIDKKIESLKESTKIVFKEVQLPCNLFNIELYREDLQKCKANLPLDEITVYDFKISKEDIMKADSIVFIVGDVIKKLKSRY